jgi:hypothetical protein
LAIAVFLVIWVFGNDMKVGRAFLVYLFGDSFTLTQSLLQTDPKLPYYRIISYDAYRLAFILSFGIIPLAGLGIWLSRRARQLATLTPSKFGGRSLAGISFVLSAFIFAVFSGALISSIPGALERGRAKRLAATRATMYELHQQALQKFHHEYGSYPQELTDLERVDAQSIPQTDYWSQNFSYLPISVIASKGSAISFSNYKLVSAGPDKKFGTEDDITMIDGVIVNGPVENDQ